MKVNQIINNEVKEKISCLVGVLSIIIHLFLYQIYSGLLMQNSRMQQVREWTPDSRRIKIRSRLLSVTEMFLSN